MSRRLPSSKLQPTFGSAPFASAPVGLRRMRLNALIVSLKACCLTHLGRRNAEVCTAADEVPWC